MWRQPGSPALVVWSGNKSSYVLRQALHSLLLIIFVEGRYYLVFSTKAIYELVIKGNFSHDFWKGAKIQYVHRDDLFFTSDYTELGSRPPPETCKWRDMLTRSCHAIVFSGFLPYVVVMGKFVIVLFVCDLCAYCLVKRGSARYLKDEIWGVQIGGLHNYLLDIY